MPTTPAVRRGRPAGPADATRATVLRAALDLLLAGRTSFVIAHRLSTVRNADQVLVLVDGEIAERGTHEELLAKEGFYYKLYMSQFKRQEQVTQAGAPRRNGGPLLAAPVAG